LNTPLCNFCIKSGILCQKCREKVKSGEVTETDVQIAKLLLKLEEKNPILQNVHFFNAYDVDNALAIVVGQGDLPKFLSSGGKIVRDISDSMGKKVRIIERKSELRTFLEDLFAPVPITAINKIWLPDGSEETRVILPGYSRRLPMKPGVLKDLAKKIRGITLRIAFENQEDEYD
jgi:transcription antitermination factor NusA-like protein